MSLRPPMLYFGAKGSIANRIVALMPEHTHYVEPYCGSLAVLLAKPRSRMETVNDLDGALVTFWRVLRDRPEELTRACVLTQHSRAEMELSNIPCGNELEQARRIWVQLTQGIGGNRRRTGWRYFATRTNFGMPKYLDTYVSRLLPAAERIAGVSLECRPALDIIDRYGVAESTLLYVDPPYLGSTRRGSCYIHEMADDRSHDELLDRLMSVNARVMISGYPSALYDARLSSWDRVEIAARTGNGADGGVRTEVVWCNRPMLRQMAA